MFDWLVDVARRANLLERTEYSEYLDFLIEVFNAIAQSDASSEVVYPLLSVNQDKLNDNLILVLRELVTAAFEQVESEQKQNLANTVLQFSNLIQQLPKDIRANNVEIAISGHQIILKFYTESDFPVDWAVIQYNLGNAYSDRFTGDRRENIETAITYYNAALPIITKANLPQKLASVHINLGNGYSNRFIGDKRENIETAILHYNNALSIITKADFPSEWALSQCCLGIAYSNRIAGDRRENFESAIACYKETLKVYTESDFTQLWATVQIGLGLAYWNRIEGSKRENIETAIAHQKAALRIKTESDFSYDWAIIQHNLGLAYWSRIAGDKRENIETSIACYRNALKVRTELDFPYDWASTQHDLGLSYWSRIEGDRRENIETAIACFTDALKVYTESDFPQLWATVRVSLGNAYYDRRVGGRKENIESAIIHYTSTLSVINKLDFPYQWSLVQHNLGVAYLSRIAGDRKENIESAIFHFTSALSIRKESNYPVEWAETQNSLGNAYNQRIVGNKEENIEYAIACYKQALKVYTESDFPQIWSMIQSNLGANYTDRTAGDKRENIETAIAYYQNALRIRTESDLPYEWAETQNNLGNAYYSRIGGENIETAISCFAEALKVRTESDFPYEWAETQNNLGNAYRERIFGDRKENLEIAISCYQAALTINTPLNDPIRCLGNSINLGNLAFNENNWQLALDAYSTAIEAIETSRSWSISDDRRREIIEQAIDVYHNIVQSYINIGQIDKAIEFTERSRSRTLVDLMASNDLYGDAEIPPQVKEFLQQFDQLQQEIDSERFRSQNDSQSDERKSLSRAAWRDMSEKITKLEQEKFLIWQEIRKLDPILAGEVKVDAPDLATIQKLIEDSQTAIISFYTTSQNTHVFILFKDQPPQLHTCLGQSLETLQDWINENWLLPYQRCKDIQLKIAETKSEIKEIQNQTQKQPELTAKLAQLQEELKQLETEWKNKIIPFLNELSQRLKLNDLIHEHLAGIQELIIIPHQYLHQIPFAALPLNPPFQGGQGGIDRLSDRYKLRHIPSCQILQFCQERLDTNQPDLSKGEVEIGTVEDADGTLPGASLEGEKIARLFNIPNARRLRGSTQATVSNYRQLAKQVNILHSSHHAQSRLDQPLESILKLGDGTITLGELLTPSWRLRNLRDVFLSCCETNLGITQNADDIFTLATGFLCAGAKSVVSTLWAVDDLSAAVFCIFYYQLRHEGYSRSQAVQKAQEKLRSMTGEELYSYLQQEARQAEVEYQQARKKLKQIEKNTFEYQELVLEKENSNRIAKNFRNLWKQAEQYCQQSFPFEHPFYWAGFISQGIR